MTASTARATLIEQLKPRYGAGEAASIARIVLEDAFGLRSGNSDERIIIDNQEFDEILARLLAGEPVQYVLGQADFFGLKFKVNRAVLIPRQETEELVAWALEYLNNKQLAHPALLDIGLGSGCIGVTLKQKWPRLRLYGVEKSPAALAVAVENARCILGEAAEFTFSESDILNYRDWGKFPHFDVIVSNPPYISFVERTIMPEHVIAYEPAEALFVDDADPLVFYRAIAAFSLQHLQPGGALFLECNEFNAREVAQLLREQHFSPVELRKDLAGADRMVRGVFPPG